MDVLEQLKQLESSIAYRTLPPAGYEPFNHIIGRHPILLSAPHATCHTRNGWKKMEEEFTYSFARCLAERAGCHALFNQWEIDEDPNWDQDSRYKNRLAAIVQKHNIKLVIDLHGMTNRHQIGVAIGTINGRSCPEHEPLLESAFVDSGFRSLHLSELDRFEQDSEPHWQRLVMNHPRFTGGVKSHTVTRFVVDELQVPAAQVEITSAARIVYRGPHDGWPFHYFGEKEAIRSTMQALQNFVLIFE